MNYKTFQLYFSNPRVNRYYYAANSSKRKTISLYKQNLLIAQAIHPVIGIFEVVLRNSIDASLCKHFQDENWIINQKDGFMSDSHLLFMGKQSQGIGRKEIFQKLNAIRQFRNRINHNEPICFVDNKFSYSEIQTIHQSIYELLKYIDERLIDFVESIDNTQETFNHLW